MVCKNCGADLKPGIKYCLECGSYLEDDDDDEILDGEGEIGTDYQPVTLSEGAAKRRKRRRWNLTMTDYLIYAGLLIVMIGSIIVIIVSLAKNNTQSQQTNPPAVVSNEENKRVTVGNCVVVIPGKLTSTVQDTTLYVSDSTNYTFSYQNSQESFDTYLNDKSKLENQLKSNKYDILSSSNKEVNGRTFIIYEIKVNGAKKVLYLTKASDKYTTMGMIEILTNGKWEEALPVIDQINNSISFQE